jgi:protein quaking
MYTCTLSCRSRQQVIPQALAGGGAGSIGGDKGSGGGGGGGWGGDGAEGSGEGGQQPKKGGFAWKGWTDRVAADPEFPFKVMLEQVRRQEGAGAAVAGTMKHSCLPVLQ